MNYSYEQAKEYILNIPKFSSKNDMTVTKAFLSYIGDISLSVPVIHVAGTNGKGSVCAFMASAFKEAGYRAAMFTSPHLVSIRERFITDGRMISPEDFTTEFNGLLKLLNDFSKETKYENYHPSFFEFLFFMGVLYWQKNKPDLLILETGLGGRLDATNSISNPKVCLITEIGLDHMEYLGDSIEKIAGEKAGIIREGVPVIFLEKELSGPVIEEIAGKKNSKIYPINKDSYNILNYGSTGIDFLVACRYHGSVNLTVASYAPYQVENAALAIQTLEVFERVCPEINLDISAVKKGIANMRWPGRMEKVLPNLIIDGGHNEDGINAFLEAVRVVPCSHRRLLFSAVSDKQVEEVTGRIIESNLFENFYVAKLDSYRAASLERLRECFLSVSDRTEFFDGVELAMASLLEHNQDGVMCFAAGSLYLVGEIKRYIDDKL